MKITTSIWANVSGPAVPSREIIAVTFGKCRQLARRIAIVVAISQTINSSQAALQTWANTGTNWNAASSWSTAVPGAGDTAKFVNAEVTQPNLTASDSIGNVLFSVAGASGYDITSSSTSITLTLTSITSTGGASGTAAITGVSTGTNTFDVPVVLGAAANATQYFTNAGTLVFNGVMTNTNSGITLNLGTSNGTYKFNGTNTFTSTATINQGAGNTIVIGNSAAFGAATLKFSSSSGQLQAGVDLTGVNKINNPLVFSSSTSTETIANSGTFGIEFGGTLDLGGGGATIASAISAGSTFDGVISNDAGGGFGVTTTNSSLVTLKGANIYTGPTYISGTGKVSVSSIGNSGVAGNLGAGTTISLGSTTAAGTLVYTGTGETTSKIINLAGTTGGATIDQSGTGLLKFTGTNTATGAGVKTLTLQGSTAGAGEISGAIVDSTTTTSVTKAGTGTWTLSGANTYSGGTSVTGGALIINNTTGSGTGTGTVAATNSGTLLGGTGTISGAVTMNAGTNITGATSGTIGTLAIKGGLTLTGTSGNLVTDTVDLSGATGDRLTITGNLSLSTAFDQITFNQVTAPTASSYTLISYSGTLTGTFDTITGLPSGYALQYNPGEIDLVAVPEPATFLGGALLAGALGWNQRRRVRGLFAGRRSHAIA